MHKKITILSLLLALLSSPLLAQDPDLDPAPAPTDDALPEGSIDVDLAFVSNYVYRGDDLFANRAVQKGESFGSHTGEWAFQPSVTFNTPVEGLSFNIWGSFAMGGRNDVDVDQAIQLGPRGTSANDDIIASGIANGLDGPQGQAQAIVTSIGLETYGATALTTNKETGGLPGTYAELNGLKRLDEIDLTIAYSRETSVGTIGFGLVAYTYPYIANGRTKTGAVEEIFVSYALPFLPDLSLTAWTDIDSSVSYYKLAYGSGVDITDGISFDYGAGVGYGSGYLGRRVQGIQDITGSVGVTVYGFSIAYNIAYRPNLAFFDTDNTGAQNLDAANWVNGGSSAGDGFVGDPGKNSYLDRAITAAFNQGLTNDPRTAGYTYTPRQKLPSTLWWVSIGYSFSI